MNKALVRQRKKQRLIKMAIKVKENYSNRKNNCQKKLEQRVHTILEETN
jgi:hypothetical protein